LYLQTHCHVDAAAEAGADGPRAEVEASEQLGEVGGQVDPGPLLRHHHQRADAGQIHSAHAQRRNRAAQAFGAQLHDSVGAESVTDL